MRKAKTNVARIAADYLPSARGALATIALKRPVTAWRANCEIGGHYPNCPTREAAIRVARTYCKRYPSCHYRIRQVKQYWGLQP